MKKILKIQLGTLLDIFNNINYEKPTTRTDIFKNTTLSMSSIRHSIDVLLAQNTLYLDKKGRVVYIHLREPEFKKHFDAIRELLKNNIKNGGKNYVRREK